MKITETISQIDKAVNDIQREFVLMSSEKNTPNQTAAIDGAAEALGKWRASHVAGLRKVF